MPEQATEVDDRTAIAGARRFEICEGTIGGLEVAASYPASPDRNVRLFAYIKPCLSRRTEESRNLVHTRTADCPRRFAQRQIKRTTRRSPGSVHSAILLPRLSSIVDAYRDYEAEVEEVDVFYECLLGDTG